MIHMFSVCCVSSLLIHYYKSLVSPLSYAPALMTHPFSLATDAFGLP